VGRFCEFCGKEIDDILLAIGDHLYLCEKAPFRDYEDELMRRNAVQLYIMQNLLKKR
jgi:hypothetical protein